MEEYIGCCVLIRQTQRYCAFCRIVWCGFLCKRTVISAAVTRIGVKFCNCGTYMSRTCLLLFWGRYPKDPKIQNFGPLEREYLENGKSQRYMSITA